MALGSFALGETPLGSAEYGMVGILTVRIQETDRTALYLLDTLSLSQSLNQRSTARLRLVDRSQTIRLRGGELVRIFQGLDIVFAGTVEDVDEEALLHGGANILDVTAVDFHQLFDRFLVADSYEGMLAGDIVRDIVDEATPLRAEGVSTAGVDDGIVIDRASFNYVKASQAMNEIADMVGFVWRVDHDRVLHFFDRKLLVSPFDFGTAPGADRRYLSVRHRVARSGYRNRQYLRAGVAETDSFHGAKAALFKGDGKNQQFTLDFEVARGPTVSGVEYAKPRVYENLSGGGFIEVATAKVGVRGIDDEDKTTPEGKQNPQKADYDFWWFWQKGDKQVSQNRNFLNTAPAAVLGTGDELKVEYTGQFPIIERQDSPTEQARVKSVEGGSGIYEEIEDDESVDGGQFAEERCAALLAREDQVLEEMEIETLLEGFAVGQEMEPDFPELSVEGQWVIQALEMRLLSDRAWETRLRLALGERRPSEHDFWRRMAGARRRFVLRENEKLLILQKAEEEAGYTEAFAVTQSNTLDPEADDVAILLMGTGLQGGTLMGG